MENKESNDIRREKINKTVAKYEKKDENPRKKTGIEQLEQMKARKNRDSIFRPQFDEYDKDDDKKKDDYGNNKHSKDKEAKAYEKKEHINSKQEIKDEAVKDNKKQKIINEKNKDNKSKKRKKDDLKEVKKEHIKEEKKENKSNITDISELERVRQERIKREKELKRQERREAIKARLKEINLKRLMIIGIISGFILIIGIIMSFTMIQTTIIDEGSNYTKREIENMVMDGLLEHNSLYLFFKYRYAEQEKIPFIEYIDVSWVDAKTVKIKVYDKSIIGCTNYMNEYLYFDKDGLVIETSPKRQKSIPYITGLNFSEVSLNNKIKVSNEEVFNTILSVTQQVTKYKLDISEINFDKNYNMTMYSGDITILFGKKETYDEQLAKLQSMLEEAKKKNLKGILHMENYVEGQNRIIFNKIN